MLVPPKPHDVLVVLKLAAQPETAWSYPKLAAELAMSASEVHASVRRATRPGCSGTTSVIRPNRKALLEFLVHGIKYAFPAERGGLTRGLPTAHATTPLRAHFAATDEPPPVCPDPAGRSEAKSSSLSIAPCRKRPVQTLICTSYSPSWMQYGAAAHASASSP